MKTKIILFFVLIAGISNLYAQNVPSYVPTNGLVSYWPFNGNANDESGNGNNGIVNGATLTSDRNGVSNKAYRFDGNSTIYNNNNSLRQLIDLNNSFSIGTWFNRDASGNTAGSPQEKVIFAFDGSNTFPYKRVWLTIGQTNDTTTYILFERNNNTTTPNGSLYLKTNTFIQPNTWHYVLVNYDGTNVKIYIDNKLLTTIINGNLNMPQSMQGPDNYVTSFNLGDNNQNNRDNFAGILDELTIYNRSLTQQEVTALYNGGTQSSLSSTKVYVDATATVNQNDTLQLSISTETLNTSDNVIAYQTDFSYDTTRYTYLSNNLVGTLNPTGNVLVNSSKNGKLSISYMTQTALNGAGSLVKLTFKANKNLGQGIFSLSDFLYNTTAVTSLKSDTVNTLDVTPPSARINYSQNPARKGDSLLIMVKFSEKMAESPVPQLNLTGQNTLANSNLTKVNDTTYTYWWVVEKGNGAVQVTLTTGKDLAGNNVIATPTQNASFTVLPTLFGDIDTNKLVQAYDAALALQYSVGLNPLPTMDALPWSNWRIVVANVDTVGNVTANDASLILQHSAKLITTFPADAKKRGGEAPVANITVTQEGNQLVFRATGTLYAFNVFMKDNFNAFGQPEVKDKNAMIATNINSTTYNVGLASTTPFVENEPFLILPILTNDNLQGTMDIVANAQEKALAYGKAASIATIQNEAMVVYPNPTKDVVTINNAQGKTVKIVDVQGKEVYNAVLSNAKTEISLKSLGAKGMYILHVLDANNVRILAQQIVLE